VFAVLFIWRGDGAWVPVVVIVVGIVIEVVAAMISVEGSRAHTSTVIASILVVSAGMVFLIARRVRGRPGPKVKDRKTGVVTQYARKDDFFFIPLDYWPVVLLGGAVVFAVVGAIQGTL
jgi:hypothetical protein